MKDMYYKKEKKEKEKLLKKINPENIELIGENDDVRLYGVKFFRFGNGREIETEITEILE